MTMPMEMLNITCPVVGQTVMRAENERDDRVGVWHHQHFHVL